MRMESCFSTMVRLKMDRVVSLTTIKSANSAIAPANRSTSTSKKILSSECRTAHLPSYCGRWKAICTKIWAIWNICASTQSSASHATVQEGRCTSIVKRHRSFVTSAYTAKSAARNSTYSSRKKTSVPASFWQWSSSISCSRFSYSARRP